MFEIEQLIWNELLEEILKRVERLERNTHRHKSQDPEYQEYQKLKEKFENE